MRALWISILMLALAACAPKQRQGVFEDCESDADCPGAFCDPASQTCVDCLYDGQCELGQVCEEHACTQSCRRDSDCPSGLFCIQERCANGCRDDGDCQGVCDEENHVCVECLLHDDCTKGNMCVQEHCVPGCETDRDCPQGLHCQTDGGNQGVCVEGAADGDCADPAKPLCRQGFCAPECEADADCTLAGQICDGGRCACLSSSCPLGAWCDGDVCQPGCDADQDCDPPDLCDPTTHTCGPFDCCGGCSGSDYCDTITCQCLPRCENADQCPSGFTCETDNKCWCTMQACPEYTHCDLETGDCVRAPCRVDADCPHLWMCNHTRQRCQPQDSLPEGAFCFEDGDCDTESELLCDSSVHCFLCRLTEPDFSPTFSCRYKCNLIYPDCQLPGSECLMRKENLVGLCIPSE